MTPSEPVSPEVPGPAITFDHDADANSTESRPQPPAPFPDRLRLARGQWAPGVSGNPTGRPKIAKMVAEIARRHTALAIQTLVELTKAADKDAVRVTAAIALLDRAYGRAPQALEHSGPGGAPLLGQVNMHVLSAEELHLLAALEARVLGVEVPEIFALADDPDPELPDGVAPPDPEIPAPIAYASDPTRACPCGAAHPAGAPCEGGA